MTKKENIVKYQKMMIKAINELDPSILDQIIEVIWSTYKSGKTIFLAGNGGSASTASHMACDLGKNTLAKHSAFSEKRIKTISLCDNISWITAVANDISFDDIFLEQLKNQGKAGDLLIIFSGSGKSINVIKAVRWAKKYKLQTVGFLGFDGGNIKNLLDFPLIINSSNFGIIESMHTYINHFIIEALKSRGLK